MARSAKQDWDAAVSLVRGGHFRQAIFLAHLSIEKALKALIWRQTKDAPPRIHNLITLAQLAGADLGADQLNTLADINPYQIDARYPDLDPDLISERQAKEFIRRADEVL